MTSDQRIEIIRILIDEFHLHIKPTLVSPEDYKEKGERWLKEVKERYQDDKIDVQATKILLTTTTRAFMFSSNLILKEEMDESNIWKALIMKGGGIKGIAYVGALSELSSFYAFNWYAGTSAGAIAATLLAVGYTNQELEEILGNKNFNDFKDANFISKWWNLISKSGFYPANEFTNWLDTLLASKLKKMTAVKFKDLPSRLSVYASRKGNEALVFDSLDPGRKEDRVAHAARCSMSIPYIFTPERSQGLKVFDGGVQNNFPVKQLLKDNPNTDFIGLYLGAEVYEGEKRTSIFKNILSIWMESNDIEALEEYSESIVAIDTRPISTLKFKLNKEEKNFLIEAGKLSALRFLDSKGKIDKSQFDYNERKVFLEETRLRLKKRYRKRKLVKRFSVIVLFSLICVGYYYFF
ncbi:hypothetical protein TPENAI_20048 [Tenacibaculum litopenaei]|uniref:patatin-like phospholipase family protein n=1 Tax=Tenacibaculum litopenaei TaxID=396016 RepID=UPI003894A4B0